MWQVTLIFEVKGTEFTVKNKGKDVSIRFPRLVKERDDKEYATARPKRRPHPLGYCSH